MARTDRQTSAVADSMLVPVRPTERAFEIYPRSTPTANAEGPCRSEGTQRRVLPRPLRRHHPVQSSPQAFAVGMRRKVVKNRSGDCNRRRALSLRRRRTVERVFFPQSLGARRRRAPSTRWPIRSVPKDASHPRPFRRHPPTRSSPSVPAVGMRRKAVEINPSAATAPSSNRSSLVGPKAPHTLTPSAAADSSAPSRAQPTNNTAVLWPERGSIFSYFSAHADGDRRGLTRIGGRHREGVGEGAS